LTVVDSGGLPLSETPPTNKTDQRNAQGRLQRNLAMGYDLVSGMKPKAMREKYGLRRLDIHRNIDHYFPPKAPFFNPKKNPCLKGFLPQRQESRRTPAR
jgi:hypothetical protein